MDSVYFGDWKTFADMVSDFEGYLGDERLAEAMKADRWQGLDVLFAAYEYADYEGDAFVLFRKDGELYEVNGGHCSCYGLSERSICGDGPDQWAPEPTTREAILHRLEEGSGYGIFGRFKDEIRDACGQPA